MAVGTRRRHHSHSVCLHRASSPAPAIPTNYFLFRGTKKTKYLEENLGALNVKLSAEEEKEIRGHIEGAEVHGLRYPEMFVGYLFADTPELKA